MTTVKCGVNALNGLISFLRFKTREYSLNKEEGVNALNGLISFLQYPLKPLENTGLPALFLQVFVRLFLYSKTIKYETLFSGITRIMQC